MRILHAMIRSQPFCLNTSISEPVCGQGAPAQALRPGRIQSSTRYPTLTWIRDTPKDRPVRAMSPRGTT